jgi:Family of unknown function (DUF6263)
MRFIEKHFGVMLLILVAIVMLAPASRASAQEELRWKFAQGQKLDYNMVQDMKMAAEGGPLGNMNTTMNQQMDMTWDVQEVKENGDAVIKQKFDRVKMKMTTPLGGFEYDSQSKEPPAGLAAMLAPMYKAMTSGEFIITMTGRGEVKDVSVPEEMVNALKNSPGAAMMGDLATSEGFKKMISQGALVLPEGKPKKGEEWSTTVAINNPVAGKQTVETTYRYEGTKEIEGTTYAVIRPELKMDFGAGDENQNPDQPQQPQQPNVKMEIAEQSSEGEVLFNIKEGRLHSSELKQNVTIDVTAGGQAMKQKIEQKIVVKVKPTAEADSEAASTELESGEPAEQQ